MTGGVWVQLALVGVLVVLNGFFAGSEIALIALSESQVERMKDQGRRGAALARLHGDLNRFMSTIQIGVTLAGFLASASAAVTLAQPVIELLEPLGGAARPTAIVLVTGVLTYVTLVGGELAPKRLALQRSEGWSLAAAPLLLAIGRVATPVVWLLGKSTDLLVRVLGGDPDVEREDMTDEDLRQLLSSRRSLRPLQRSILTGAFDVAERQVREILRPRREVILLQEQMAVEEGLEWLVRHGVSRAPVVTSGELQSAVGVVHLRDLVGSEGVVGDHVSEVPAVPETMLALDLLNRLQRGHAHLALVVDEYGTVVGIVTLEDVLEELVGEIYDEADDPSQPSESRPDHAVLDGALALHDAERRGVDLPRGDYATVAGLLLDRLGQFPDEGTEVEVGEWRLRVEQVDDLMIRRVLARPTDAVEGPEPEEEDRPAG